MTKRLTATDAIACEAGPGMNLLFIVHRDRGFSESILHYTLFLAGTFPNFINIVEDDNATPLAGEVPVACSASSLASPYYIELWTPCDAYRTSPKHYC